MNVATAASTPVHNDPARPTTKLGRCSCSARSSRTPRPMKSAPNTSIDIASHSAARTGGGGRRRTARASAASTSMRSEVLITHRLLGCRETCAGSSARGASPLSMRRSTCRWRSRLLQRHLLQLRQRDGFALAGRQRSTAACTERAADSDSPGVARARRHASCSCAKAPFRASASVPGDAAGRQCAAARSRRAMGRRAAPDRRCGVSRAR